MRVYALALVVALGACTSDGNSNGDGDGDGDGSDSGSGELTPPARGFQIETPTVHIAAGEEVTYCYYFRTSNTEALSIKKWQSVMTPGSHHLILYFTPQLAMPEGTMAKSSCGIATSTIGNIPTWVYSAQDPEQTLLMPADDGEGQPVGMDVPAGQAAMLELHYNNRGDEALDAQAKINAEAYDAGVTTTKTFAYVTYNPNIEIPPMSTETVSMNCNISPGAKVWMMSTHAHRLAINTKVLNGIDVVFESDDWEHPGAKTWMDAPFYSFSTGTLTSECTYNNPGSQTVYEGDSAETEEMCMASGYIFPATKPTICYSGFNI